MSSPLPSKVSPKAPQVRPRNHWRDQLIALTWLVLVWNLLWGEFTWGNVIGGLIVALIVLLFFPLPPVTFQGRIRPLALARFVGRFFSDLVGASVQVSWLALRPGPPPLSAVIAVPLRVNSDLNLTLVSEAVSLVPGSLIVEADPRSGVLYVHVFGVRGINDVEEFRREVLRLEERIVRAIGSAAEVSQLTSEEGVPA
ncbi:MAG TPA: Na+/H+ antiporter subunit E [Micromonosporaceae bacterium]|nr:Na+/H+ antiporter subunit E [Micromonosporaceae bacterium]